MKDIPKHHTLLGTPLYMPPQILEDRSYSYKCDVWSTGCLFYECIFGKLPWTGNNIPGLIKNIKNQQLDVTSKNIHDDTKDLIKKMLTYDED